MSNGILVPDVRVIREWTIPLEPEWYSLVRMAFFPECRPEYYRDAHDGYNTYEDAVLAEISAEWIRRQGNTAETAIDIGEGLAQFEKDVKAVWDHLKLGFRNDPGDYTTLKFTMWKSGNVMAARTIEDQTGVWKSRSWTPKMNDEPMHPLAFIRIVKKHHKRKDTYYYSPRYRFELKSLKEVEFYQNKYDEVTDHPNGARMLEEEECYDEAEYAMKCVLLRRQGLMNDDEDGSTSTSTA